MTQAPPGWHPFGTHAGLDVVPALQFKGRGEDGLPLWERRRECPAMPGIPRCHDSICDCFRDVYPLDPVGLHPEAFVVGLGDPDGVDPVDRDDDPIPGV
jgi:hypothetical protein